MIFSSRNSDHQPKLNGGDHPQVGDVQAITRFKSNPFQEKPIIQQKRDMRKTSNILSYGVFYISDSVAR